MDPWHHLKKDLSKFQSIVELLKEFTPGEHMIIRDKSIIYKDLIYSLKTGEKFNFIDELRKKGDYVDYSMRVRYSDQIMLGIRQDKVLKLAFVNDPGSRSRNPFGHGIGFGLPSI